MHLFVPDGVDIESSYVCPYHINKIYPELEIEQIEDLIDEATNKSEKDSIGRLIEESYKTTQFNKDGNWKRIQALQDKYHENKPRYRYGKRVAGVLSGLLQKALGKNSNIYQTSEYIKTPELAELFEQE